MLLQAADIAAGEAQRLEIEGSVRNSGVSAKKHGYLIPTTVFLAEVQEHALDVRVPPEFLR
eukprot:6330097-Karenia_brevis.AAC.1